MTEQALLQRLEEIQRKLDEIRAGKATLSVDENGKEYNVEIQRTDKGADRKRARYHSSILDAHLLQPGDDFSNFASMQNRGGYRVSNVTLVARVHGLQEEIVLVPETVGLAPNRLDFVVDSFYPT